MRTDGTMRHGLGEGSTLPFLGQVLGWFPPSGALLQISTADQEPLVVTRLHRVGGSVGTRADMGRARPGSKPAAFLGGARRWLSLSPPVPWSVGLAIGKLGTLGGHLPAMS